MASKAPYSRSLKLAIREGGEGERGGSCTGLGPAGVPLCVTLLGKAREDKGKQGKTSSTSDYYVDPAVEQAVYHDAATAAQ